MIVTRAAHGGRRTRRGGRTGLACAVGLALGLAAATALASEPVVVDLARLNERIGLDYETLVAVDTLVADALGHRLLLYGEAHDQEGAARRFLELVEAVRRRSDVPLQLGVEFVDRGDADILEAYLQGILTEQEFLERLMPTSLLLSPDVDTAHLDLLRYARDHGIPVVPLESRPAGARPRILRNSEIRWNLARHLGRFADERLLVLYGVDHVLGDDPIHLGLPEPACIVTSYGDSVVRAFHRRERRFPKRGEVVRLRPHVYLQATGGGPRPPRLIRLDLDDREELLMAIESLYAGDRTSLATLVEALLDPEVRWRRAAFHALRFATGETFSYDPEAPEEARLRAQRRWRAWLRRRAAPHQ